MTTSSPLSANTYLENNASDLGKSAGESGIYKQKKSLKIRATMVAIALSTLPVFVIGSIAYTFASKAIVRQITLDHRQRNELAGTQIDNFLVSRLRDLEILALNPKLTQGDLDTTAEQQQAEIQLFFETLEYFDSLILFDTEGNSITQVNEGNPFRGNYSDRDYFQAALQTGQPTMNGPGISKSSGKLRVEFAVPVKDKQTNETRFVIRARIPGKYINQLFTLLENKGNGWYLVNESGTLFAGSDPYNLSRSVDTHVPRASDFVKQNQTSSGIFPAHPHTAQRQQIDSPSAQNPKPDQEQDQEQDTRSIRREQELLSYVPVGLSAELPERQMGLITYSDAHIALAPQRRLAVVFAIGTALTGLIAASIALLLVKRINDPIQKLTETARTIVQEGRFDLRAPVMSEDEIGSLATSLNQLIEWVSSRTQALEISQTDLEQRTQELSAIINSLGEGLLVTDRTGRIVRSNPPLLKIFGHTEKAIHQQLASDVFATDVTGLIEQSQTDPSRTFGSEILLPKGRVGQALVNTILDTETAEALGCVMLIRDITAEKEVDRMKTDFISTVSHELRTPLTSVLGFAKIIQKKLEKVILPAVVSEEKKTLRSVRQVKENLEIIVSEGERLTSLINDVLDIAKIEAGKIEWRMSQVSVEDVIRQAIAATSVLAEKANIALTTEIEPNLPTITADQDRLVQVVINLISNAVKFTDNGTVTCEVKQTEDEMRISVIDTGKGISDADQQKVFEKFKQVGEVMTDKPQGTGLGLPICKQIIDYHHGRIWVESKLDVGSTFSVALPLKGNESAQQLPTVTTLVEQLKVDVKQTVQQTAETIDGAPKTILVVDAESNIRRLLRQELEQEGYQVTEAADGVAALSCVKQQKPDLIITDVMMPRLDGFDLTAVLKSNPETHHIPTIILSIVEDCDRGFRLGADRYLSKPIEVGKLLQNVETLITDTTSRGKVLIIDKDTPENQALTDMLLSKGYIVATARTGQEGLDKARSIKPNMIIVDAALCKEHDIIKTLRYEKGLENVSVILVEEPQVDDEVTTVKNTQV